METYNAIVQLADLNQRVERTLLCIRRILKTLNPESCILVACHRMWQWVQQAGQANVVHWAMQTLVMEGASVIMFLVMSLP